MRLFKGTVKILGIFTLIIFFQNCGYNGPSDPQRYMSSSSTFSGIPSYEELYSKIFQSKCLACHSTGTTNFSSYSSLISGGSVVPGDVQGSLLYQQISSGQMPKGGVALSSSEVKAVASWIADGAKSGAAPDTMPSAPSNLVGVALSSSSILLTWVLPVQNVNSVRVERSLAFGGAYSLVATIGASSTYTDTNLVAGTSYYYRVSVSNSAGTSGYSNIVNVTLGAAAPAAPTSISGSAASSSQINLTWVDNSNNETGFKIEQASSNAGPFNLVATTAANATGYTVSGLNSSTTYYFRVKATNSVGDSVATTYIGITTLASGAAVPSSPTNLSATAVSSTQINLSWTDTSASETGFKVERATSQNGAYSVVATLGANVVSYSDTGLAVNGTYFYRVSSYNANGNSSPSPVASATTFATYSYVSANVFQGSCVRCHSGTNPPAGFNISTYSGVITRVVAGNATGSLLFQKISDGSMPPGGGLSTLQIDAVKSWINSGALNN
jgi:mono/diheme cytochrome c family protein